MHIDKANRYIGNRLLSPIYGEYVTLLFARFVLLYFSQAFSVMGWATSQFALNLNILKGTSSAIAKGSLLWFWLLSPNCIYLFNHGGGKNRKCKRLCKVKVQFQIIRYRTKTMTGSLKPKKLQTQGLGGSRVG